MEDIWYCEHCNMLVTNPPPDPGCCPECTTGRFTPYVSDSIPDWQMKIPTERVYIKAGDVVCTNYCALRFIGTETPPRWEFVELEGDLMFNGVDIKYDNHGNMYV